MKCGLTDWDVLFGQNDSQTVYLLWLSCSLQKELVVFFLLFKVHFVQQLVCLHSNSRVFVTKKHSVGEIILWWSSGPFYNPFVPRICCVIVCVLWHWCIFFILQWRTVQISSQKICQGCTEAWFSSKFINSGKYSTTFYNAKTTMMKKSVWG